MSKSQCLALSQIRSDVLTVDLSLNLVVDQHHNDISPLRSFLHSLNSQTGLLGLSPVLGAGAQADTHIAAGILQVQSMSVTLRSVTDDCDFLTVQVIQVAILLIIHLCHGNTLLKNVGVVQLCLI